MEESEVPDHSKSPRSRDTPNVISVGTGNMPISFKKAIKFAATVSQWLSWIYIGFTNDKWRCS